MPNSIHAELSAHVATMLEIREQHPSALYPLNNAAIKEIDSIIKFLVSEVKLIKHVEDTLPLLENLDATVDVITEVQGRSKTLDELKEKTQMCIKNFKPFDVFQSNLMGIIATFLPRPDIRTLEKFTDGVEVTPLNVYAELVAGIKYDRAQPVPNLMQLFVDEFVKDYRASPDDLQREMKIIKKAYHFLKHASFDQQQEFFSTFFLCNIKGNPLDPEYPLLLKTILRELPNMEGLKCLNIKSLTKHPSELLEELVLRLANGPVLQTVQQLGFNGVNAAAIAAIVTNPYIISNLERLEVTFAKMSDPIIASLNQMPYLKTLEWIDPTIEKNERDSIVVNLSLVSLERFAFEGKREDDANNVNNLRLFLSHGKMANLKNLYVYYTSIDTNMMTLILSQTQFPKLEELEFSYCEIPLASIEMLAQSPRLKTIKSLTLDDLDLKALRTLVSSHHLHPEFTLNLAGFSSKSHIQNLRELSPNITIKTVTKKAQF